MDNKGEVKDFLAKEDIHKDWISAYRNKENEGFFNAAFNKIVRLCDLKPEHKILDAGCGSANHTIRLAKKGLNITAIDFSESVLEMAMQKIADNGLSARVSLQHADLTALPFEDNTFDAAYCWGVLMHIPDVEYAVKELSRVVKPGGFIIVSEANKNSAEIVLRRLLKRSNNKQVTEEVESGIENWYQKGNDKFFVRQANMDWLTKTFRKYNAERKHRFSGQFSEAYTSFGNSMARKMIHGFNNFWFKVVRSPRLAFGNILIFKKNN